MYSDPHSLTLSLTLTLTLTLTLIDCAATARQAAACSQPTNTTRLLAQLTPMLLRAHQADAAALLLASTGAARMDAPRRHRRERPRARPSPRGSTPSVGRVAGRFGSEAGLRAAYSACISHAARARLLCPLLEDAAAGRCAAGGDAPCCRLGKGVLRSLMGGGGSPERGAAAASGCIDLTADAGAMGARAAVESHRVGRVREEADVRARGDSRARGKRAKPPRTPHHGLAARQRAAVRLVLG